MLAKFRNGSKHLITKIFLVLIAFSFILWGVGDIIRGNPDNSIASVGDQKIDVMAYQETLRNEINRIRNIAGNQFDEKMLEEMNIKTITLQNMIDQALMEQAIKSHRIYLADRDVVGLIKTFPFLQNEKGEFDKNKLRELLQQQGISEAKFFELARNDFATRYFVESLVAFPPASSFEAGILFKYRNQARIVDIANIPASYLKIKISPSEDEIVNYYKANKAKYALPEMRKISYFIITKLDFAKNASVFDAEIEDYYNRNLENFVQPETRDLSQLVYSSKENAETAIASGKKFEEMALDLNQSANQTHIKNIIYENLEPSIAAVIKSLQIGQLSNPVQSPIGWHIFRLDQVNPMVQKSLASVKNDIKKSLEIEKIDDATIKISQEIEDAFASGSSAEEIAQQYNLNIIHSDAFDKNGKSASGNAVNLPADRKFLDHVFVAEATRQSPLFSSDDGNFYYSVRVDEILSSRDRSLDEVRGAVTADFIAHQQDQLLQQAANDIAASMNKDNFVKITKSKNLNLTSNLVVSKNQAPNMDENLLDAVFNLKQGQISGAVKAHDGGYNIVMLDDIQLPQDIKTSDLMDIRDEIMSGAGNDIMASYFEYLKAKYPVKINQELLTVQNKEK